MTPEMVNYFMFRGPSKSTQVAHKISIWILLMNRHFMRVSNLCGHKRDSTGHVTTYELLKVGALVSFEVGKKVVPLHTARKCADVWLFATRVKSSRGGCEKGFCRCLKC